MDQHWYLSCLHQKMWIRPVHPLKLCFNTHFYRSRIKLHHVGMETWHHVMLTLVELRPNWPGKLNLTWKECVSIITIICFSTPTPPPPPKKHLLLIMFNFCDLFSHKVTGVIYLFVCLMYLYRRGSLALAVHEPHRIYQCILIQHDQQRSAIKKQLFFKLLWHE